MNKEQINIEKQKALRNWAIYDFIILIILFILFRLTNNFNFIWAIVGFEFIWAIYALIIIFKSQKNT